MIDPLRAGIFERQGDTARSCLRVGFKRGPALRNIEVQTLLQYARTSICKNFVSEILRYADVTGCSSEEEVTEGSVQRA